MELFEQTSHKRVVDNPQRELHPMKVQKYVNKK